MRILVVSNFYPPARPGGYTQWCYEINERLKNQGHQIDILTSRYQIEETSSAETGIHRLLHLDGNILYYEPIQFFLEWKRNTQENINITRNIVENVKPDLVFIWGMWAMSKSVPATVEKLLSQRTVYFISDYWPAARSMHEEYWSKGSRHLATRFPKKMLGRLASNRLAQFANPTLEFKHTICVSEAVKNNLIRSGQPLNNSTVIHGGTDLSRFKEVAERSFSKPGLKLLYAGQLVDHKGVHTTIEAVNHLRNLGTEKSLSLTIVGSGHPAYEQRLRTTVSKEGLEEFVKFREPVPMEAMPDLLAKHDVLLFPSIYEEPLARMTQEGMAAGMVVIGTTTGGTKEILKDGENGLTFPPEDSEVLSDQILRLIQDRNLCKRLAKQGRKSVEEYFNLDRMATDIGNYLEEVLSEANSLKPRSGQEAQSIQP